MFWGEIMRGFDLRKLQLVELEMLKDVVSFCEKNDIQYFLSDGTLIGAARHQGFIPWDDDIDICMDYKNFKKFNKLAAKDFDKKYFVQNYKTERKYPFPWTKIRINSTTSMERHLNNYDIHFGICMDILVLNGISDNKFRRKLQVKSAKLQRDLLKKYYYLEGDIKFDSKKKQIMYMVKTLLKLESEPKPDDTADALAAAICHIYSSSSMLFGLN